MITKKIVSSVLLAGGFFGAFQAQAMEGQRGKEAPWQSVFVVRTLWTSRIDQLHEEIQRLWPYRRDERIRSVIQAKELELRDLSWKLAPKFSKL